ncbi:ATP-binding protein [Futiania mangrovi]|uniref:histidine kinase n=1 Tax=Futiania mangrovi TaxID=2959716 RepID=A0A9J6PFM4_9PROT|nr:ATP-binding protein [Futiania mangrovii]MCP1337521.1 ATP-binding protein [Futiania mangrovii]
MARKLSQWIETRLCGNALADIAPAGSPERDAVEHAQIRAFRENSPYLTLAGIINMIAVIGVFSSAAPAWMVFVLPGLIGGLSFSRLVTLFQRRPKPAQRPTPEARVRNARSRLKAQVYMTVTGVLWGVWMFMLAGYGNEIELLFLCVVACGIAAGGMYGLFTLPLAALGFTVPAVAPVLLRMMTSGSPLLMVTSLMGAMFLIVLVFAMRGIFSNFVSASAGREMVARKNREIEDLHADYLATASDWIWASDPQHRLTYMTHKITELTGIEPSSLIGRSRIDFLLKDTDCPEFKAHLDDLDNRRPFKNFVYCYKRPDGQRLWFSVSGKPVYDEAGTFQGYRGTGTEVSARMEAEAARDAAEAELRKANEELEQRVEERTAALAQREAELEAANLELTEARDAALEAAKVKAQFLATMSHEIRTPMNGVLGMAELLRESRLNARQKRFVDIILRSGRGLLEIINDILDLSKIEAGKMELEATDFDLHEAVTDVIDLFGETARSKGLELTLDMTDEVPQHVSGDTVRLRQVLTNLISNALKFTGEGGVHVAVSQDADDPFGVVFSVRDTGIGMSEDALGRIFEAFTQAEQSTTRKFGGTGLGLTISRQLVEMMGGDIGVESREGEGSRFWFTARFAEAGALAAALETADGRDGTSAGAAAGLGGMRVLVAEDNPVNQVVALESLAILGIDADIVENGREAVQAVARERYDVILMDMEMPEMDGLTAAREIRAALNGAKGAKIIAMTAHDGEEERQKCRDAGMDDYISKPFSLARLRETLERWIPQDKAA